jgi:hypothetical protein
MKTIMVAPQGLGQSKDGGAVALEGWSEVEKDDNHCTQAQKIPKLPRTGVIVNGDGKEATRNMVSTPGRPQGRIRPSNAGAKLCSISRTVSEGRKVPSQI